MTRTTDVVAFLCTREAFPGIYKMPFPGGAPTPVCTAAGQLLLDPANPDPGLMIVQMIVERTGYLTKAVYT